MFVHKLTPLTCRHQIPPPGEDSSHEVAYVGQHQQGLGGLYADSLLRKRKFREVLDARCKSFF